MKKVSIKIVILFIILSAFFVSCKVTVNPKPDKEKELYEAAKKMPLTLLAEEDGTITLRRTDLVTNLKYTINGGEPVSVYSRNLVNIDVVEGDEVCFYGEGTNNDLDNYLDINCSKDCSVYGNVMSLLTAEYQTATEITTAYAFRHLFAYNKHLKNHQEKMLVLPATTLSDCCYYAMFINCKALTEAPELPATTLTRSCYNFMFGNCTSLTKAPELSAKTLATGCYDSMFFGCININSVKSLATDISAQNCTRDWLYNVSSEGTFITPSTTQWPEGDSGIPTGWTRVNTQ